MLKEVSTFSIWIDKPGVYSVTAGNSGRVSRHWYKTEREPKDIAAGNYA